MTSIELEKGRKALPHLFGYNIAAQNLHKVGEKESGFNFPDGIPSLYSSLTGQKVCRGDMNGLGRLVSQGKWFSQNGGYYTFDATISDAIGGYPEGAILYFKEPETGYVRPVRSLVPDNTNNFVEDPTLINGVYWDYVDNAPPTSFRPRIFPLFDAKAENEGESLSIGEEVTFDRAGILTIQTGADATDTTSSSDSESGTDFSTKDDFYLYLTVRRRGEEEFHTAGLIAFIPTIASFLAEGMLMMSSDEKANATIANRVQKGWHAYNSPCPIQVYLLSGDTIKLKKSWDFAFNETYQYTFTPLTA